MANHTANMTKTGNDSLQAMVKNIDRISMVLRMISEISGVTREATPSCSSQHGRLP